MTESNEIKNVTVEDKAVESKVKKALTSDTSKKLAVSGAAGFATGFMTVLGTMAAQKMFEKLEEHKSKKMLKKAKKEEAHEAGESDSTEEVED